VKGDGLADARAARAAGTAAFKLDEDT